jgi:hypothetical protein
VVCTRWLTPLKSSYSDVRANGPSKDAETDQVFADQLTAIKAGIELANERGKNGTLSVVLLRKSKDEFRKIWTYGVDSYPPSVGKLSAGNAI